MGAYSVYMAPVSNSEQLARCTHTVRSPLSHGSLARSHRQLPPGRSNLPAALALFVYHMRHVDSGATDLGRILAVRHATPRQQPLSLAPQLPARD